MKMCGGVRRFCFGPGPSAVAATATRGGPFALSRTSSPRIDTTPAIQYRMNCGFTARLGRKHTTRGRGAPWMSRASNSLGIELDKTTLPRSLSHEDALHLKATCRSQTQLNRRRSHALAFAVRASVTAPSCCCLPSALITAAFADLLSLPDLLSPLHSVLNRSST
jgi:hypothetical protein